MIRYAQLAELFLRSVNLKCMKYSSQMKIAALGPRLSIWISRTFIVTAAHLTATIG